MATRNLKVVISGDPASLQRAFTKSGASADKFSRTAHTANMKVSESFSGLAKKAAGMAVATAGAYASIAGAKNAIDTTEELAHSTLTLSKNFGLTIEQASQWGAVAKARGIETSQLAVGFKTLSAQTQGAITGGKAQVASFKQLGITQQDLTKHGNNLNFVLRAVSDGLGKLPAGTERASLQAKLFGRAWQGIAPLIRGGSKAMDEQLALADKYGVTFKGKTVKSLEDLIAAQRESKFATMGLQVAFGTMLAPALTKAMQAANKFVLGIRDGTGQGGKFRDVMEQIANRLAPIVKFFRDHPKLIAVAVAAWGAYKIASAAALVATRLKLIGTFVGLGTRAAAGGAEAGTAYGRAFSATSGSQMAKGGAVGGARFAGALRVAVLAGTVGLGALIASKINKTITSALGGSTSSGSPSGNRSDPNTNRYGNGVDIRKLPGAVKKSVGAIGKALGIGKSAAPGRGAMLRQFTGPVAHGASMKVNTVLARASSGQRWDPEQLANARTIIRVGESMGASEREILAAIEAAIVESGLRNLSYGDRDSVGVFQQRPSAGWKGLRNVSAAAAEFFQHAQSGAGGSAGTLAQSVQRSAFPGRYDQVRGQAASLISMLAGSGTGGTLANVGGGTSTKRRRVSGGLSAGGGRNLKPFSQLDYIEASVAQAGLTSATGDDVQAARSLVDYWKRRLKSARKRHNPKHIADAANNLAAAKQSLASLTAPVDTAGSDVPSDVTSGPDGDPNQALIDAIAANTDAQNAAADAEKARADVLAALRDEVKKQNDFATQVTAVSLGQAWRAMADMISGQIAGTAYQGRALTAGAGSTVRY